MKFEVITIFPDILDSYINQSILGRAQAKRIIKIRTHNLREATKDRHRTVDDRPYGGGPGMIMMVEPIYKTLKKIKAGPSPKRRIKTILLDPAGKQFDQATAQKLSKFDKFIFICGRYEGIDARVDEFVDEKISIGPYILSGGELPALVIIEAVARLIPGVVGKQESLKEETYSTEDYIEYPQYTRPEKFIYQKKGARKEIIVDKVLLSGNHKQIEQWKKNHSKR